MSTPDVAEIPMTIAAEHAQLFGIRSEPRTPGALGAVVLPANGNAFGGRTRFALRLARQLAGAGLRTLRVDYEGTGESGGGVAHLWAADPALDDALAAARALVACGHERIVLIGYCYGARVAIDVAGRIPELEAVVLISPPVEARGRPPRYSPASVVRGVFQPARWRALRFRTARRRYGRIARRTLRYLLGGRRKAGGGANDRAEPRLPRLSEVFVDGMVALGEARVPTLLVLGELDRSWSSIQDVADEHIDRLLEPGASSVELRVIPGAIHGLRDEAAEDAAIALVTTWAATINARS